MAEETSQEKKTLLLLSSTGGGGHIAACHALEQMVGKDYNIKMVYPINDLKIWGLPSCESFYNQMLKTGWIRSMNFIVRHVVPTIFRARKNQTETIISSYIDTYNPDLIISLIPFINYPASEAARKADKPFLIISTDNDLRNWLFDMEKATYTDMRITIGDSDLPFTKALIKQKGIPFASVETTGLPLRSDFLSTKDRLGLCKEWNLDPHQKRVLIMMGGAGGVSAYKYAKAIAALPMNLHILVIAGRNEDLQKELEEIPLHESNQMSILGFTDRISDLMAVSDVLITKPGPGTLNEGLNMHLPMLIDHTDSSLFWERSNVDWVLQYGVGQKVKDLDDLSIYLNTYLYDASMQTHLTQAFLNTPANQFHLRVPALIAQILEEQ
ncbi:MAG: UDP-N-acetylglucosamine:LPS N-acetylglucosamine transferase [Chlamydiota bacterium]|jgi:processive 1,2-diacylglycerol beta-glucosyltransferase